MTSLPIVVILLPHLLYHLLYPITPEIQKEMVAAIAAWRELEAAPAVSEENLKSAGRPFAGRPLRCKGLPLYRTYVR